MPAKRSDLREASVNLAAILESITDAFFALDTEWRFAFLNREAERLLDRQKEDVLGKDVWGEFPEAVGSTFYHEYHRAVAEGQTVEFEEYYPPLGTWFEVKAYPSESGLSVYFRDVTGRKKAEEALKESEARLRSVLVQYASDIITILEADGTVRYESPAVEKVLGHKPEDLVGTNVLTHMHPDDVGLVRGASLRVSEGFGSRGSVEVRFRHADGSWRWLEGVGNNLLSDPAVAGIVVNFRDVTERRLSEERLAFQANILNQVRAAVIVIDLEGTVTHWNGHAEKLYGYSREEALGRKAQDLLVGPVEVAVAQRVMAQLEKGEAWEGEFVTTRRDGSVLPVHVNSSPIWDGRGTITGFVGVSVDVTERKRAEEAVHKQNEYLTALHETALGLVNRLDLDDMLNVVLARAADLIGADDGYVFLAEPDDESVPLLVSLGVYDRYDGPHVIRRGEGFGGKIWESGKELVVNEYVSWPGRKRVAGFEVPQAVAGVPIRSGSQTIGVLALAYTEKGRRFEGTEVEMLGRFAAFAAIAIENARLYNQAQQELAEREEAEGRLREAEERYRTLVERVPPIIYVQQPYPARGTTYDVAYMSPRVEEVLGWPPERFTNDPQFWNSVVHPGDLERVVAEDERTDETGERFSLEYRMIAADGSVVWVRDEASLIRGRDDEPLYWQGAMSDITERKALEERLAHQALHDELTGLPNRTLLMDRLEHALSQTRNAEGKVAVLFLDLDNFKFVNDTLGHQAGDRLLVAVAERLRACLRPGDTAARLGGDEFGVLLEGVEAYGQASGVAGRIIEGLRTPFVLNGQETFVTPSIGVALGRPGEDQPEDLLREADLAMYRAKEEGKGRHEVFDPGLAARATKRLRLGNDLRRALERHELAMHYQPVVRLADRRIAGVEALLRWNHPMVGPVPPGEFIPLAEETGLVDAVGLWALREACRQGRAWQEGFPAAIPTRVSVNLSAKQLRHRGVAEDIEGAIRESGFDPALLTLEITESSLMEDEGQIADVFERLGAAGVHFALDDFGMGYFSFSCLRRLPVDLIKLHGSFLTGLGECREDEVLLSGVVDIAHGLGLKVLAEGVETREQLAWVESLECDLAQGYLFSNPLSAEDASRLLDKGFVH